MKKTITFFIICFSAINLLNAQTSGGPDTYGYTWRDSNDGVGAPVYNWIDIVPLSGAQNVRFLDDDNTVGSFPIGFPFHFYWYDVTQFWVGSNGYIGFTNGQISSPFPAIPSTSNPQNFIAAFASDLVFGLPGDTAQCWRWTNSTNDTLIVSYLHVPFYQATSPNFMGSNTFQIILSAVDSSITFQYKEQLGSTITTSGNFSSVGIENNSGNIGLQQSFNTYPQTNYAVKFKYPSNTTYAVSDAATMYNSNPETGGAFLSNLGSAFTMSTNIKNTGNQNLASFNVFSRVLNAGGAVLAQNTLASNALAPGQSQSITMPNTFSPTSAGTYTFVTNTQLAGDITPSNNQKVQELQVVDTTATSMLLSYDNGTEAGLGGLSWTGGQGGGGIYFVPPFHPAKITQMLSYVAADPNGVGFSMEIFADNGIAGSPGTMLDSEALAPGTANTGAWNIITLPTPIIVNAGGVFVSWSMNGDGVALGQDNVAPFSNQTFEVINNTWAIYRSRETADLMINLTIEKYSNVGISELKGGSTIGEFYPNPSSSVSSLNFEFTTPPKSLSFDIFDVQGKLIEHKMMNNQVTNNGKLTVNTESMNAGIYTCKINVDGNTMVRKLVIAK